MLNQCEVSELEIDPRVLSCDGDGGCGGDRLDPVLCSLNVNWSRCFWFEPKTETWCAVVLACSALDSRDRFFQSD